MTPSSPWALFKKKQYRDNGHPKEALYVPLINDNLNMYINDHLRMYTSDYALI